MQVFLKAPNDVSGTTLGTENIINITVNVSNGFTSQTDPHIETCPTSTAMGDRLIIKGKNFSPGNISTYTNRGSVKIGGVIHEGKYIEQWEYSSKSKIERW